MGYEAFDRDAAFAASGDTAKLSKLPTLAIACQGPVGNTLQRQLAAAGLKNLKAVTLDDCAHWIYEENPSETLPVLLDFLSTAKALP